MSFRLVCKVIFSHFSLKVENLFLIELCFFYYHYVGSQIVAHTYMETGDGPNKPNTINL